MAVMPDNNLKKPNPQTHEDGVEETAHAGCGLPIIAGIVLMVGFILY